MATVYVTAPELSRVQMLSKLLHGRQNLLGVIALVARNHVGSDAPDFSVTGLSEVSDLTPQQMQLEVTQLHKTGYVTYVGVGTAGRRFYRAVPSKLWEWSLSAIEDDAAHLVMSP